MKTKHIINLHKGATFPFILGLMLVYFLPKLWGRDRQAVEKSAG